jgi:hypothetical protein
MHIDSWTQWKPSPRGAGPLACGVLTLSLLSGVTLSQSGGGTGQQGGAQGKGGAETAPARQREQPGQAREDVGGKLAGQLGRLHEEFKDQLRSALVDADVGRYGRPVADELVVTMYQGLIVAGYPVEPGSAGGTPGAGASGGDNGRETGANGQPGAAGGQAGGRDAGAKGGQEATASKADAPKAEGQLIGVVIVGGTDGSNRPASHAGAVEAGAERNADGRPANAASTGRIGEGSYGVFLMTPNMVALRREDGTTVRTVQIRHDAGAAQPEHGGNAAGEARTPGQGEKGEKGEGGVGAGGQRPSTTANDTARLPSDFRPAWDKVYLAVLMEIEPGEGAHREGAAGAPKH